MVISKVNLPYGVGHLWPRCDGLGPVERGLGLLCLALVLLAGLAALAVRARDFGFPFAGRSGERSISSSVVGIAGGLTGATSSSASCAISSLNSACLRGTS